MQAAENPLIAVRDPAKQASPRKMYVDFVGRVVQLGWEFFDCSPDKQNVSDSAFRRLARRPHRNLPERLRVRIDSDEKLLLVLLRGLVHKATVAGSDIHNHSAAGKAR
jgi:hypothetical protein